VPLWTKDLTRARTIVMEHVAFWSGFVIALAAKYLGFFIGPEAFLQEWAAAVAKYQTRTLQLLRVDEGLLATVTLHNIQACPVLYYLAQLLTMPADLHTIQNNAVELLTHGPR